MGVAGDNHLFARASDGDIELAVDDVAVFLETVAGEEVELVAVLDGERIDDDIALAALVALDSIDGHLFDAFDTEAVDFLADHGYLVAVGHDDAYGLGGVETVGVVVADVAQQAGDDLRLVDVNLVGESGLTAETRGDEDAPAAEVEAVG